MKLEFLINESFKFNIKNKMKSTPIQWKSSGSNNVTSTYILNSIIGYECSKNAQGSLNKKTLIHFPDFSRGPLKSIKAPES